VAGVVLRPGLLLRDGAVERAVVVFLHHEPLEKLFADIVRVSGHNALVAVLLDLPFKKFNSVLGRRRHDGSWPESWLKEVLLDVLATTRGGTRWSRSWPESWPDSLLMQKLALKAG